MFAMHVVNRLQFPAPCIIPWRPLGVIPEQRDSLVLSTTAYGPKQNKAKHTQRKTKNTGKINQILRNEGSGNVPLTDPVYLPVRK